jgi:16S rRNA (guanine(966)-N(2))-methyltransferase RsmD
MRIISGTAANLILKTPEGFGVRPTPDLVRQAIFNSLGERVLDARVLELFGGTGALSLECLSRGAAQATCIEKNFEATKIAPPSRFQLRLQDVFDAIPQLATSGTTFDLILADPPFGDKNVGRRSTSMSQQLLDHEQLPSLLAPGGLFVLGHTRRDTLTLTPAWTEKKEMKHGDSMVRFLVRSV